MARPTKAGLDYFPLDVHMDDKVNLIEAQYGLTGFAVVIKLWQQIYADKGYYTEWGEQNELLFAGKNGIELESLKNIIAATVRWGIFDADLLSKYKILTSAGIQKRYREAKVKSKNMSIEKAYLLISVPETEVISEKTPVISEITPQSKVKESKENKSKGKKSNNYVRSAPPTIDEVKTYIKEHKLHVDPEYFYSYYKGNGWMTGRTPMVSWEATLRSWNAREKKQNTQKYAYDSFPQHEYTDEEINARIRKANERIERILETNDF